MLKAGVCSTVTCGTDLANLTFVSYAPGSLAVMSKTDTSVGFIITFVCSGSLALKQMCCFPASAEEESLDKNLIMHQSLWAPRVLPCLCLLMNHALVGTVFVYCCCHSAGIKRRQKLCSAVSDRLMPLVDAAAAAARLPTETIATGRHRIYLLLLVFSAT